MQGNGVHLVWVTDHLGFERDEMAKETSPRGYGRSEIILFRIKKPY